MMTQLLHLQLLQLLLLVLLLLLLKLVARIEMTNQCHRRLASKQ